MKKEEKVHDPFGGSKWPAFSRCPAYRSAVSTSKDAQSGSRAHFALEMITNTGGRADIDAIASEAKERGLFSRQKFTDEEVASARWAYQQIVFLAGGAVLHPEQTVTINCPDLPSIHGIFGTVDNWAISREGEPPIVFDFKSMAFDFPDYKFEQFVCYAAGLMNDPFFSAASMLAGGRVRFVALLGGSRTIAEKTVDINEAVERSAEYIAAAKACNNPSCGNPCESCDYCTHALDCPARMRQIDAIVADVISPTAPYFKDLDPANQRRVAKFVSKYIESWEKHDNERLLAEVKETHEWKEAVRTLKDLAAKAGITGADGAEVKFVVSVSTSARIS